MEEEKIPVLHRLEFFGYQFIEKLVRSIPDGSLPGVARFFAFLTFYLLRIRRQVSLANLRIAFPEKDADWHRSVAYFSYLHFSLMILEFMKMQKWDLPRVEQKIERLDIEAALNSYQAIPSWMILRKPKKSSPSPSTGRPKRQKRSDPFNPKRYHHGS